MTQAIVTTYIGPTNRRGARIKAKSFSQSLTVPYDYTLDGDANHHAAAQALATKFDWRGFWVHGGAPDGKGNVYVNAGKGGVASQGFYAGWPK